MTAINGITRKLPIPLIGCVAAVLLCLGPVCGVHAETNVIDGVTWVCEDGVCRMVDGHEDGDGAPYAADGKEPDAPRIAEGYMNAAEFIGFLRDEKPENPFADRSFWMILVIAALTGFLMNLTPCVLPLVPVNLILIGRSAKGGLLFGLGLALAYGSLGLLVAGGATSFGALQSSWLFDFGVAATFLVMAAAMAGWWIFDLAAFKMKAMNSKLVSRGGPFLFGILSAVLASACVAPVLVSALVLTADLAAKGNRLAVLIPFAIGIGMALPWPFLGAGMKLFPRPGAWMTRVNRVGAVILVLFAVRYAWLGFGLLSRNPAGTGEGEAGTISAQELAARLDAAKKPVLVKVSADWCTSCREMERTTLRDEGVLRELEGYEFLRLHLQNFGELADTPLAGIRGLPAFAVFGK